METQCTKTQTETYHLRWKGKAWWAIFYVDEAYGAISVQSDFGDYSYRFGAPSKPFKEFLAGCDTSYITDKFSYNFHGSRYFYEQESMKKLRELATKKLVESKADQRDCAEVEDAIAEIDDYSCRDGALFCHLLYMSEPLMKLFYDHSEAGECCVTGYHPRLVAFMKELWPAFKATLKEEIARGKDGSLQPPG